MIRPFDYPTNGLKEVEAGNNKGITVEKAEKMQAVSPIITINCQGLKVLSGSKYLRVGGN
jgi:hypothetical protein